MEIEVLSAEPTGPARPTPLLFVHGKWHGAWCWQEHFLPFFAAQGYRSYALSLRGHAGSAGHDRLHRNTIADYLADVASVVAQLPAPPVLIGHSMGGFITQKYLETHPAPAAVLLTSVPPTGLWPTLFRVLARHPLAVLKSLLTWNLYPLVATPALARWALFSDDMPEADVRRHQSRLGGESFRATLDELGLNLVRARRIRTPLLVLGAEYDRVIPPRLVHATARAYGTTAEILPGMAHDVMLEAGWERAAARILAWLKERNL